MSDVYPITNDVNPAVSPPPVEETQKTFEDVPDPEEIDNTEVDSGQNVDTFA